MTGPKASPIAPQVPPAVGIPAILSCRSWAGMEAKAKADGFRELYGWLDQRDVLIVKADRHEALVIVRMSLAV